MMDFNELFEKLNQKVREETTTSDIAYAPAMGFYGTYRDKVRIEKEKEKEEKEQEKVQRPLVPESITEEDIKSRIERLKDSILKELEKIVDKSKLNFDFVERELGLGLMRFPKALIEGINYVDDLMRLRKVLPPDVGELEMILSALSNKTGLNRFDVFSRYEFLYGVRLGGNPNAVPVVYEGFIDMGYREQELLYIRDKVVLEKIADRFPRGVLVRNYAVYPLGGVFRKDVLRGIAQEIKEA